MSQEWIDEGFSPLPDDVSERFRARLDSVIGLVVDGRMADAIRVLGFATASIRSAAFQGRLSDEQSDVIIGVAEQAMASLGWERPR